MKKIVLSLVMFFVVVLVYAQPKDEEAIKKLIETETVSIHTRNLNKWLNCFAQTEDVVFGYHASLPVYMIRGYKNLEAWGKGNLTGLEPNKDTFVNSDFRIRIKGETAFVSCISEATKEDGRKTKTYKADYLEKIDGTWKIVGHLFGNEPAKK